MSLLEKIIHTRKIKCSYIIKTSKSHTRESKAEKNVYTCNNEITYILHKSYYILLRKKVIAKTKIKFNFYSRNNKMVYRSVFIFCIIAFVRLFHCNLFNNFFLLYTRQMLSSNRTLANKKCVINSYII